MSLSDEEEFLTIEVSVAIPWTDSYTSISRRVSRTEWENYTSPMKEHAIEKAASEVAEYMTLNEENYR